MHSTAQHRQTDRQRGTDVCTEHHFCHTILYKVILVKREPGNTWTYDRNKGICTGKMHGRGIYKIDGHEGDDGYLGTRTDTGIEPTPESTTMLTRLAGDTGDVLLDRAAWRKRMGRE